ncbi:MAG: hypothetical protein ACE5FU_08305, partial [Nitrospinota bacterium]
PANARGTLLVSPDPIHTPLLQPVQGVYGNNSIYVAWKTDSPTTTDFFYKAVSDSDFTVFQGPPGLEHRVELPGLLWGETYQWYAESHSQCGMTQTETNSGVISRGVTFDLRGSEVAINRDYNQLVSMNITNIDYFEHAAMVRVINPYDDIGAGFVGVGTETEIVEISPGETITPQLFVHAGDALETRYVLYAEVTTDPFSPDPIYDRVPIVVNIRPVDVNLDLEEIEKSIFSMTNSYRLMNYGDTIPDVKVFVKDPVSSRVVINPAVNHGRLESGEFLEFVISGSEPVNGVLVAEGNLQTITIPFQLGCRKEQNLQNVTMTGPTVEIDLEDWYFTDRQDLEIPFSFPSGYTRDAIERAYLKVTFNPVQPKNPTKAYTVKLFANDELISTFFDETPEGEYFIGIPVHLLQIATYGTGTNSLRLRVEGTDEGAHFVVTDMKAGIVLDQMNMQVCANETPPPTCPDCALFPPPPPFPERLDVDGVYQP